MTQKSNEMIQYKLSNFVTIALFILMLANPSVLSAQETKQAGEGFTSVNNYIWRHAVPGDYIGKNALHAGDYDGDGNMEIICGANGDDGYRINYWYKLEYAPERKSFDQVWVSPYYNEEIGVLTVIEVLDIDGDGFVEILTGNSRSEVCVYDAVTMNPKSSFALPSWDDEMVHSIVFADANNDGSPELVCCTDNATYFMDPNDFSFKDKIWVGGRSMKCDNVDDDPELELVYSIGSVLQVEADYTYTTWEFHDVPLNKFPALSLFDIDSDGMSEIYLVADSIWVYDAKLQNVKMTLTHDYYDFDAVQLADMNLDGIPEIYAGTASSKITVYDTNGLKTNEFRNIADGVTGFVADDLNNDGIPELMWGTGHHSTENDFLVIYNPFMDSLIWKSPGLSSPFTGIKIADIDGDENNEIISITSKSLTNHYTSGPLISIHDAATHKMKWQSADNIMINTSRGCSDFEIADVDYDGDMEIIMTADLSHEPSLWAFNCRTLEIESNNIFPELDSFHALEILDTDNDGELDYVVAGHSHLYYIDPIDYSVTWTSPDMDLGSWFYKGTLNVGNTDADHNKEIVWLGVFDIFIFDVFTKVYKQTEDIRFSSVCLYDYDQDGISEIIAGTYDGKLAILDGHTLEITWLPVTFDKRILSVGVFNVPGKEKPVFALITNGMLYFTDALGNMFSPIILGSEYESNYGIEITDYDNNGISEIFVTYNTMVTEFSAESFTSVGLPKNYPIDGDCIVSPNPSNGIFKILIADKLPRTVSAEIYSLQGVRVAIITLTGIDDEIDLGDFPSGIYLLHINAGHKTYQRKLVKN